MYIAVLAKHASTWEPEWFSTQPVPGQFSKSLCQVMDENREVPDKPSEASAHR